MALLAGLVAYMKPYRKDVYAQEKAKFFLAQFLRRQRRRTMASWKKYCVKRQRCRFLVACTV